MTSDQPRTTIDALAVLTIPSLDTLTEHQVRGITCVWDAVRLTNGVAVDLGARKAQRAGSPVSWYPRACRSCTYAAAFTQLTIHVVDRDECKAGSSAEDPGDASKCGTCMDLLRLMKEYG